MCNLAEGIYEQGIEKGILDMIMESVEEGDFSLERGAQKLGLTIQELTEQMKTAGRKIPA